MFKDKYKNDNDQLKAEPSLIDNIKEEASAMFRSERAEADYAAAEETAEIRMAEIKSGNDVISDSPTANRAAEIAPQMRDDINKAASEAPGIRQTIKSLGGELSDSDSKNANSAPKGDNAEINHQDKAEINYAEAEKSAEIKMAEIKPGADVVSDSQTANRAAEIAPQMRDDINKAAAEAPGIRQTIKSLGGDLSDSDSKNANLAQKGENAEINHQDKAEINYAEAEKSAEIKMAEIKPGTDVVSDSQTANRAAEIAPQMRDDINRAAAEAPNIRQTVKSMASVEAEETEYTDKNNKHRSEQ